MDTTLQPFHVYVDGIWDLFHEGHQAAFQKAINKAKEFAGGREVKLIVGVCGEGVAAYKRDTIMSLSERVDAVSAQSLVDTVVANSPLRMTGAFMDKRQIDLVVHGDDFNDEKRRLYYGPAIDRGKYASVPYTKGVSTTELIIEAKTEGKLTKTKNLTQLPTDELIGRIQERTWEELKVHRSLGVGQEVA